MKPIVKWAGGKTRLLAELLSRIPGEVRTYVEPFAGGAALFFALADAETSKRVVTRAVLADQNAELVACYRAVKTDVAAVIEELRAYSYDRDLFYEVRARDTAAMGDAARAARLIFLNRTCFNGLWRVNASGRFNVPFGRYTNPRILDEVALRAASRVLAKAKVIGGDFMRATKDAAPGDFVYFDPPYTPLPKVASNRTPSFTSYGAAGFSRDDHERLLQEFRRLKATAVPVMLSNADTPETRELYKGLSVHVVSAPRAINSDASKRGETSELLVTSWGKPGLYKQNDSTRIRSADAAPRIHPERRRGPAPAPRQS